MKLNPFDPFLQIGVLIPIILLLNYYKKNLKTLLWGILCYVVFLFTPGPYYLYNILFHTNTSIPATVTAAIVPSGGTILQNEQNKRFLYMGQAHRLLAAIELYQQKRIQKLVLTGKDLYPGYRDEVTSMKNFALFMGVASSDIITENQSNSTFEHAINLKPILLTHHIREAFLVTNSSHLLRAGLVFKKHGISVYPLPSNDTLKPRFFYNYSGYFSAILYELSALGWYYISGKI